MDIGTAKPTRLERQVVPHHLIDVANPDEYWSLAVYQKAAELAIESIHKKGKLPFLVGGTGQYIHALLYGWTPPKVEPDQDFRKKMEDLRKEKGQSWIFDSLKKLDPEAAGKIDPRNVRRVIRALEVIHATGNKFSEQQGQTNSVYHKCTIGLFLPRERLYEIIDKRIEKMFLDGLVDEVSGLLENGTSSDLPSMSAIGYKECIEFLKGKISIEEAKKLIKRRTRVFVRRQANWFKAEDHDIFWCNSEDPETTQKIIMRIQRFLAEQ